jgi:hypothetical protein
MDLSQLLSSKTGTYLISAVLGFGLATLLVGTCSGPECTVLKAPDPQTYATSTFRFNDKCWSYANRGTSCNTNKAIIDYA